MVGAVLWAEWALQGLELAMGLDMGLAWEWADLLG
jgi:hypothetical protein